MSRVCQNCIHAEVCGLYDFYQDSLHAIECNYYIPRMFADVAPRIEVAKEIFAAVEFVLKEEYADLEGQQNRAVDADAWEALDGQMCGISTAQDLIERIKKKYTKEN